MRIAISTALGDAPTCAARAMPTGQRSALDAVLLMNWVSTTARAKSTAVMRYGDGSPPIAATVYSAINLPAPEVFMAVATGIIPAKRKIVTQSIES